MVWVSFKKLLTDTETSCNFCTVISRFVFEETKAQLEGEL
jgi:hypothetical protein